MTCKHNFPKDWDQASEISHIHSLYTMAINLVGQLESRIIDLEHMHDAVRRMELAIESCEAEIRLQPHLDNAAHSGLASRIDDIVKHCNKNFTTIQGFIDDYRKSEAEQEDKEPACPTCGGHHG